MQLALTRPGVHPLNHQFASEISLSTARILSEIRHQSSCECQHFLTDPYSNLPSLQFGYSLRLSPWHRAQGVD